MPCCFFIKSFPLGFQNWAIPAANWVGARPPGAGATTMGRGMLLCLDWIEVQAVG